jgi:hypothetical protein
MNYTSAMAWVQGMNDANYLGHSDWQLPTAPLKDPDCSGTGPAHYREGFAFGCDEGALGYLYYIALGYKAPNTAVPIPPNTVGPFTNFQPNLYWSDSDAVLAAIRRDADCWADRDFVSGLFCLPETL